MRGTISTSLLAIALIGALTAVAEEPAKDLASVHEKLQAEKKTIVAQYMELTESEAKAFWPVYEEIQKDLGQIGKRTRDLLESYAADYKAKSLTDEKAKKLIDDWIAIDQDEVKLRGANAQKVMKVLPARKAARYLQIEYEYRTMLRYGLAATVPLAQ